MAEAFDSIIIGAGAAGLYAAMHAAKRGRRVLVLERNAEPGAKIIISGGGRCNFTNLSGADHARYLSANPHFARSALSRHPPADFIALVQKHGITFYEKTLGQLFCEGARSSRKIVRMLLAECAGADIRYGCAVKTVRRGERFIVETEQGAFESETLAIATGGLSIPKLGATQFAYTIARQFGVPIVETRPGLVPLTFDASDLDWLRSLAGVSTEIIASSGGASFREAALITHRGLSGPAILQISSYWRERERIAIDWLAGAGDDVLARRKRQRPKLALKNALSELLPDRLATALLATPGAPPPLEGEGEGGGVRRDGGRSTRRTFDAAGHRHPHPWPLPPPGGGEMPLHDMKDAALTDIARALKAWPLSPAGTEGYSKAEVTTGGVSTGALSQQSMECKAVPGLFFIGECVDVTGWLGGYNFQWAWSSGWAAGQAL